MFGLESDAESDARFARKGSQDAAPKNRASTKRSSRRTTYVFLRLPAVSCEKGRSSPSRIRTYNLAVNSRSLYR